MRGLASDLRFGIRMLLRKPAASFVAILTLALGIGAGTAMFSVVDAVLLRPLPYRDADRLVFVWSTFKSGGGGLGGSALPNYRAWRDESHSFAGLAGFYYRDLNVSSGTGDPERLQGAAVTPNLFPVLGVSPPVGRMFLPEEDQWGHHQVVLLSHRLWQRRFGGDRGIVGTAVPIGGRPHTVVGIMPAGMAFFDNLPPVDLWVPISFQPGDNMDTRNNNFVYLVGRLRPGVTLEQAQGDVDAIARRIEADIPQSAGFGGKVVPAGEQLTSSVRPMLFILFGAVALLLLVACVNVANLLLARAVDRQKEMAVRASLGATRGRLFRQMLVESLLLAAIGGTSGLLLAAWGLEAVSALLPETLPRHNVVGVDARVLAFTAATSVLTVVLFGTLPALQVTRGDVNDRLKEAGARVTDGRGRRRLRGLLVAGEMALAVVLLVGAALLGRSFVKLHATDAGFVADEVVALRIPLSPARYPEPKALAFFAELAERLRGIPGATAVGMGTRLPLGYGAGWGKFFWVEGSPVPPSLDQVPLISFALVDHDYFRALGVPLRGGRAFAREEDERGPSVAIVNEAVARRFFDGQDPVGRSIRMCPPAALVPEAQCPARRIVGVAADAKTEALGEPAKPLVYVPYRQYANEGWLSELTVVLRAANVAPASLVPLAREQIRAIDKDQPIADVVTGTELRDRSMSQSRFSLLLFGLFALLAAVLAAVGIYGVVSYLTAQRTHEMGVRMALGARPRDVKKLVLAQGMAMAVAGVAIGLAVAFGFARVLRSLLYGVTESDPLAYVTVAFAVGTVALVACWLPARRAARTDPMTSLRSE